jgi:hypothetical protein
MIDSAYVGSDEIWVHLTSQTDERNVHGIGVADKKCMQSREFPGIDSVRYTSRVLEGSLGDGA